MDPLECRGIGSVSHSSGRGDDLASQMDKYLKKEELAFFKELIAAIVQKNDGCLDHNGALRLGQKSGGRLDDGEAFIERMVHEGWLEFRFTPCLLS
jgi:hypothetical protein